MASTIWLCEMVNDSDREFLAGFKSEDLCLKQAGYLIVDEIIHHWDMSNKNLASIAKNIYNKIKSGSTQDLRQALQDFNIIDNKIITVMYTIMYDIADDPIDLDDSFFNLDEEEEPSDKEIKDDLIAATTATGATCRKCSNYFEYSTPDTNDGSFICCGCSIFIKIFSDESKN